MEDCGAPLEFVELFSLLLPLLDWPIGLWEDSLWLAAATATGFGLAGALGFGVLLFAAAALLAFSGSLACFLERWGLFWFCSFMPSVIEWTRAAWECELFNFAKTCSWWASYSSRLGNIFEMSRSKLGSGRRERFDTSFFLHVGHSWKRIKSCRTYNCENLILIILGVSTD